MGMFVEVAEIGELEDGAMKAVEANGREVLLARVGDSYYAVSNKCPHMGGKLSEGWLDGHLVTCLRHGSQFDLRDGQVIRWAGAAAKIMSALSQKIRPPKPLDTFNIEIRDGRIEAEI